MRCLITAFLTLLCLNVFTQHRSDNEVLVPMHQEFSALPSAEVLAASLEKRTDLLKQNGCRLQPQYMKTSPGGYHFHFRQTWLGIPLLDAELKATLDRNYVLRFCSSHLIAFRESPSSFSGLPDESMQLLLMKNESKADPRFSLEIEKAWLEEAGILRPVYSAHCVSPAQGTAFHIVCDAGSGEEIFREDIAVYHHAAFCPPTTDTAWAKVFRPDPLTSSSSVYGGYYLDNNDADSPFLNSQRVRVQLKGLIKIGGVFNLSGPYVRIEDIEAPVSAPAIDSTGDFDFLRSEQGFEDVNAYYHVDTFQRYVQSLGFDTLYNIPIRIDPHAIGGQDQSKFVPNGASSYLAFGEGGVDDAEDADVLIHEYGHALSYAGSPGSNAGNNERKGLDEGIGDYFASSYSRDLYAYNWFEVFTWDGHNQYWDGRYSNVTDTYTNVNMSDIYALGALWSSTLMELWASEGRNVMDRITLQELYLNVQYGTLPTAASKMIYADSLVFGGQHTQALQAKFCQREILSGPACIVHVEPGSELSAFRIWPNPSKGNVNILGKSGWSYSVMDVLGREWKSGVMHSDQESISMPQGIWFIRMQDNQGGSHCLKWISE